MCGLPRMELTLQVVIADFNDGTCHGRLLFNPDYSCLGDNHDQICRNLRTLIKNVARKGQVPDLLQRLGGPDLEVVVYPLTLDPPRRRFDWELPMQLKFHGVIRAHTPTGS